MTASTDDFFRSRLDHMIDLRHPLAVLANRMPWQEIEDLDNMDFFGATVSLSGAGVSNAGRPRLPLRLMASLRYFKHAFNGSDEEVCQRWGETPVWQYFSLMFNTSGTQVADFIGNGCPIADYKTGLERFSGVGRANSKAANNDF